MIGETLLMNTDREALQSELIKAWDDVISAALKAFGVLYEDPKELAGRLSKQRHIDWEEGRWTYLVDGKPFLNMTTRHSGQTVRLSWVSIDKNGDG